MPYCHNCGAELGSDEKFCAECGAKVLKQVKKAAAVKALYCPNCGVEVEGGEKFCAECGTKISPQAKKVAPAKVKAVVHKGKVQAEVMENCGDGVVFAETSEPAPTETRDKKPRMAIHIGKKKIMLLAGVAIIVVALVAVYMFTGSVVQAGVPIYPDATEATIQGMTVEDILAAAGQSLPSGWTASMYQTTATAGELTYWYRTNMLGWTKIYDDIISEPDFDFSMDILGFARGDDGAFIASMILLEEHYFIILEGPAEEMQDIIDSNF